MRNYTQDDNIPVIPISELKEYLERVVLTTSDTVHTIKTLSSSSVEYFVVVTKNAEHFASDYVLSFSRMSANDRPCVTLYPSAGDIIVLLQDIDDMINNYIETYIPDRRIIHTTHAAMLGIV